MTSKGSKTVGQCSDVVTTNKSYTGQNATSVMRCVWTATLGEGVSKLLRHQDPSTQTDGPEKQSESGHVLLNNNAVVQRTATSVKLFVPKKTCLSRNTQNTISRLEKGLCFWKRRDL